MSMRILIYISISHAHALIHTPRWLYKSTAKQMYLPGDAEVCICVCMCVCTDASGNFSNVNIM
jgi:hypothetical protein